MLLSKTLDSSNNPSYVYENINSNEKLINISTNYASLRNTLTIVRVFENYTSGIEVVNMDQNKSQTN